MFSISKTQQAWLGVLVAAGSVLWACSDDQASPGISSTPTPTPTPTPTATSTAATGGGSSTPGAEYNATYKALFTTYCLNCHNANDTTDLSAFDKIKAKKALVITRIESTTRPMPPSATSQWTNTDKARVLQYLKTSTDFN